MSKHTPIPWYLYKSYNDGKTYVLTEPHVRDTLFKGRIICDGYPDEQGHENMRLIVLAVNAHDELLAALKEIAERGPVDGYGSADALRLRLVATQSIARAAIAKAENP
jgi:hypothetical protein